jgi:hypothetical protein
MQRRLASLTQHMHVMMQLSVLVQVVVAFDSLVNDKPLKLIKGVGFSKDRLLTLIKLINANQILIEATSHTFMSLSEYFEIVFSSQEQRNIFELSKEVLRVHNQAYYYEQALELAVDLKTYVVYPEVHLRDWLDLAIANTSNVKIYISSKKDVLRSCIESLPDNLRHQFEEVQLHDIDSFIDFISNDTNLLDVLASQDMISLYTREGRVISMKRGVTPVDFAYKIHTDLGHSCYRAKITRMYGKSSQNTFESDLNFILEDGDKVEIVKHPSGLARPDISWCKFAVTDKAIDAIQAFWSKEKLK